MSLRRIVDGFSSWIDLVADTVVGAMVRLHKVRSMQLIEARDGTYSFRSPDAPSAQPFRLDAGTFRLPDGVAAELHGRSVELVLQPTHFLFRPLELPKRAAEFLDGIVRAQIDRLTPWSPGEAVFGWAPPSEMADDRIGLTVAATPRTRIAPHVQALKAAGAKSIVVSTWLEGSDAGSTPIRVHEHVVSGMLGVARVRSALLAVLVAVSAMTALATAAAGIVGAGFETQLDELNERIAEQRRILTRGNEGGETAALHALEQRKHDGAATVLVLEALSQVLPDHTYVTEMQIERDKLQVTGVSRDAPALIRLLEQSSRFAQATFAAPTTRAPQDAGERFHIAAQIRLPTEVEP